MIVFGFLREGIGKYIFGPCAVAAAVKAGDALEVDFDTGVITDATSGETFQAEPFPPFMQELIAAGGLAAFLRKRG